MEMIEQLKEDFEEFGKSCRGILLFGSFAGGEQRRRSDIDVCIVTCSRGILDEVYGKVDGKYDIKVFEDEMRFIKTKPFTEEDDVTRRALLKLVEVIERKGALEGS